MMDFVQLGLIAEYWVEEDDDMVIDLDTDEDISYDPWSHEPIDPDDWDDDFDE